jgi:hypothetical protein
MNRVIIKRLVVIGSMSAIAVVVLLGVAVANQSDKRSDTKSTTSPAGDRWERWRPLLGVWEGNSQGAPGKGKIRLEFSFVMNERYLKIAGTALYEPRAAGEKGERHEDFGYVSFDRNRRKFVFRQFHIEGFVNQYVMTSDRSSDSIELTSEAVENTPPGWRARETYKLEGGEIKHVFELADKDKAFEVYASSTLKRVKA